MGELLRNRRRHDLVVIHLSALLFGVGACTSSELVQQHGRALGACIPSGTEADINGALAGTGAEAVLCPNALFILSNPVRFSAPNQRLYTQGFPTDETRALLRIGDAALTNAINGNNQS